MRTGLALAALVTLAALGCGAGSSSGPRVPEFGNVVVVVFENKEAGEVVGSASAPAFAALAKRGASLTAYHGVAHPSLPNYLALVSGSTQGVTDDCVTCHFAARNIADSLTTIGKTWRTYAEGLPQVGFLGPQAGRYVKRHNPLVYFDDVANAPDRASRIVPLRLFARDLAANRLPAFSFVVPDVCNDMHDCPVATGDRWLGRFVQPLLASPHFRDGVVFVLFDEGSTDLGGGGHVAALVLGPLVRAGATSATPVNHYSTLRTIEESWGLVFLGRSAKAKPITGIWR
jgi:acid phosphatase